MTAAQRWLQVSVQVDAGSEASGMSEVFYPSCCSFAEME